MLLGKWIGRRRRPGRDFEWVSERGRRKAFTELMHWVGVKEYKDKGYFEVPIDYAKESCFSWKGSFSPV